jgi:hypothetical protein
MPVITSLSQEVFRAKKIEALETQPLRKTVLLSQIRIVNPSVLELEGKNVPMTPEAFTSFAKFLGIPESFQERFQNLFGEEYNMHLVNKIKSALTLQKDNRVTLLISPKTLQIVHFSSKPDGFISNKNFLDMAEKIIDRYKLNIREFTVDPKDGGVVLNTWGTNTEWQIKGLQDEFFRGGLSFINGVKPGLQVSSYIDRLVCANGMVARDFDETLKLKTLQMPKVEEFMLQISKLEARKFIPQTFEERVLKAIGTRASLAEMEAASSMIMKAAKIKEWNEIESYLPIIETRNTFSQAGLDPKFLSADQKKNARTGVTVWDVVNVLTNWGTNDLGYDIEDTERRKLQVKSGKMLAETFDIENLVISPY